MFGGREAFFLCMTMSAADALKTEKNQDVTETLRVVCRWRREDPVAFHEIFDHILATTSKAPDYRKSLSPVDPDTRPCPPRGEVNQMVREAIKEQWLSTVQIAHEIGSTVDTVQWAIRSMRSEWAIERGYQLDPATKRHVKVYHLGSRKLRR